MTNTEVHESLKVEAYGLLKFDNTAERKQFHGKVKYIDSSGTIVFKDNDSKLYLVPPEKIISFTEKEMLPKPTEHKGKEIYFKRGCWYYKDTNKECDLNR